MDTPACVFFLIAAFWGSIQLHLTPQTENAVVLRVSAADVATQHNSSGVREAALASEDTAEETDTKAKTIRVPLSASRVSRSAQRTKTLKAVTIFAAAVGLLFAAFKLWECRAALSGASHVQLRPAGKGEATSR
ncbi:hypothetical protein CSUI_008467, partial [Cystoisospora suis]